jgi:hypothetical protein
VYTRQLHGRYGEVNNFHSQFTLYCVTAFHRLRERGVKYIILGDSYDNYKALPQINHIRLRTDIPKERNGQLKPQRKLALGLHNIRQYHSLPVLTSQTIQGLFIPQHTSDTEA